MRRIFEWTEEEYQNAIWCLRPFIENLLLSKLYDEGICNQPICVIEVARSYISSSGKMMYACGYKTYGFKRMRVKDVDISEVRIDGKTDVMHCIHIKSKSRGYMEEMLCPVGTGSLNPDENKKIPMLYAYDNIQEWDEVLENASFEVWTPTFIDTKTWLSIVSPRLQISPEGTMFFTSREKKISGGVSCLENLLYALFWQVCDNKEFMWNLLKNYDMTKMFIKAGCLNCAIVKTSDGTVKAYFDKNGILKKNDENTSLEADGLPKDLKEWDKTFIQHISGRKSWRNVVEHYACDGMSLSETIKLFLTKKDVSPEKLNSKPFLEQLCTVGTPQFERNPGNNISRTFDRIRVTVGITASKFDAWGELVSYLREHKSEVASMVIKKIEQNKNFQKKGVPIGFLKVSSAVLARDYTLEYILELKDF